MKKNIALPLAVILALTLMILSAVIPALAATAPAPANEDAASAAMAPAAPAPAAPAVSDSAIMTIPATPAANPALTVKLTGAPESVNGKRAYTVEWKITANEAGIRLRGSSGLRLAYDNTVLQLMRYSGAGADYALTDSLNGVPSAGRIGAYEDAFMDVRACQSADGATGYVTIEIGHSEYIYECAQGVEETLAGIRFAFRDGKSSTNIGEDSIRLMTVAELENLVQPAALNIVVASGDTNIEYAYCSRTAADSIDAPEIRLNGESGGYLPGDVNFDGRVNMQDVLLIYQYFRAKTPFSPEQRDAADVNRSGAVDMQDVLRVYQYFRGKITTLS